MWRLPKGDAIKKARIVKSNDMRKRLGVKDGRFASKESVYRTDEAKLSGSQKYQKEQFEKRASRHVLMIEKMTETAYKTTQGNPLHYGKETNIKQSIKTTAMRMQVSNDVIARIESMDNKLLNELYQVSPDILQRVYIYAWRDTEISGVYSPPDKSSELEDFFEVYDKFVETRGKYI